MKPLESDYAIVKTIKGGGHKVLVPVSTNKPEVPEHILKKWQRIVNTTARILQVPTGLLTRLSRERLHVVVASKTPGNPYKNNDSDTLGIGMFCESVAGARDKLLVQDTNESEFWKNNPHAGLGMKSYCGVPIYWDDGEIFGTFCMLSDKTNQFSELYQELLLEFKDIIESDLHLIRTVEELEKKLDEKELYMREVHHRVKNHFNLLISLIHLQAREDTKDIGAMLNDLQNRVRAIALVHEKLHSSGQKTPCLQDYISQLADVIIHSFSYRQINIDYDIDKVDLPLESSVPVGLIIAELLSNSLKYAAKGSQEPVIEIQMKIRDEGMLLINYGDNGPGYPPDIQKETAPTLGMNLVHILTEQLGGKARIYNNGGARYSTEIRYINKKQAAD